MFRKWTLRQPMMYYINSLTNYHILIDLIKIETHFFHNHTEKNVAYNLKIVFKGKKFYLSNYQRI